MLIKISPFDKSETYIWQGCGFDSSREREIIPCEFDKSETHMWQGCGFDSWREREIIPCEFTNA